MRSSAATVTTPTVTRYLLRAYNALGEPVFVPGYYGDIHLTGEKAHDWYEKQLGFIEDARSQNIDHPVDPSWRVEIEERTYPVRDYLLNTEKVCVLIEEEYGWRSHVWHTSMNEPTLRRFFAELNNVHGACPPDVEQLPGLLVPWTLQDDSQLGVWSVDPDTYKEDEWEGPATRKGLVFLPYRDEVNCSRSCWNAHFHTRDDTHFHPPDEETP